MERLVIAALLVAAAVLVALLLQRRRPQAPTQARWRVPVQLDRDEFDRPEAPWLVAVFTSGTCRSCEDAMVRARVLESAAVAVHEVETPVRRDLHERYAIEAVPTVVVADREGVVRASFVGPPPAAELWAAVAEVRES